MITLMPRMLTILATITLLFTGCTGPEQPTYSCTPETGGAPFPCYKAQWELYQKQDRLYTEAETVYRKFSAEEERIYRIGGVSKLTPVLEETTTGSFRKWRLYRYVKLKEESTRIVGGQFEIVWIKRNPAALRSGSAVSMDICREASTATFRYRAEKGEPVANTFDTYQFVLEGDRLKITSARGKQVAKC